VKAKITIDYSTLRDRFYDETLMGEGCVYEVVYTNWSSRNWVMMWVREFLRFYP